MAVIQINGKSIDIGNEKLNLIQAGFKVGVFIPYYCWHPALTVVASCRMCMVEVGERKPDGSVTMQPRVVPACQTLAKDGMVVLSNSPMARSAQRLTLEGLLLNHPLDCPVCDKAGECLLQDYSFRYGNAVSRLIDDKFAPPNKPNIGRDVALFTDRCIKCSRCVRFTREVSGQAELQFITRGEHEEIDIFPGIPCDNKLAGNVVDICPVGALCSKDFLYTQRAWYMNTRNSVCPDCSTGCSIFVDSNKDVVFRLRPRYNPQSQGHFMCDDGRLGYHYINSNRRIRQPLIRRDGQLSPVLWAEAVGTIRETFRTAVLRDPAAVIGVLSPFMTCEEAYLLAKFLKGLSPRARLALGPVPIVGEDDTFPKDRRGRPAQPVLFTIRAEKCPNRKGVEMILRHFQGEVIAFTEVLRQAEEGTVQALYIAAGYPPRGDGWVNETQATTLGRVPLLAVQEMEPSPASQSAQFVIPAVSFAEKDGTFVNYAGLAQAIHRAVIPPDGCRSDGQFLLKLLDRRGLFHAPSLRRELASEIAYFAPLVNLDGSDSQLPHAPEPSGFYSPPGFGRTVELGTWLEPRP